jgi:polar amino acid transport system substrate-binding protein
MNLHSVSRWLLGVVCVSGLAFSVAQADILDDIRSRGSITIAVDFTHPPYGMLNAQSEQTGTDLEIAQRIARDLGVKLNLLPVNGPNRIPFLLTGKADIVVASFSVTEERKKIIAFSRPYATEPTLILAPASQSINTLQDLSGKAVAVARGTTADLNLTSQIKAHAVSDVNITRYLDEATARTAISSGQQTLFAASMADASAVRKASPDKHLEYQLQLSEDPLAIGLRLQDTTLKQWLDNWVAKNQQNGVINDIWLRYFGRGMPAVPAS